jgi:signal transduction histidine kinase
MNSIDRELTRFTHLIDNVLQFSRAEHGVLSSQFEVVYLGPELQGIVDMAIPLARSRNVRILTRIDQPLLVRIHRDSFRQVILNLIDNAVKYGPSGQEVGVSAERIGDQIRIAIEDEGPGVERDEREAIWEPFYRGQLAVGTAAAGSGIGLSVVREIVDRHGGTTRVEDATNRGARFVIEIPAADALDGVDSSTSPSPAQTVPLRQPERSSTAEAAREQAS